MDIQALYIKSFGGLKEYSLRLKPRATLLYGPNERGKTTVLTFIRAMFYGLGERRGQDSLRDRYTPRDGSAMAGNLWFSHEGTTYELSRSFGSRKALDLVTLTDLDRNRLIELENTEQPGLELFGLTAEVFTNSVFVEPSGPKLASTADSRRELWETLSDFLVSPDSDVPAATVQERIRKARLDLKSASGKKGQIPQLAERIQHKEAEVRSLAGVQDEEARLGEDLNRLYEQQKNLEADREMLEQAIQRFEYAEDRERLRLAEEPFERVVRLENRLAEIEESDSPSKEQVASVRQQYTDAQRNFRTGESENVALYKQYAGLLRGVGIVLLVLGIALFVWTYLQGTDQISIPFAIGSGVLAMVGLGMIIWGPALADTVRDKNIEQLREVQATEKKRAETEAKALGWSEDHKLETFLDEAEAIADEAERIRGRLDLLRETAKREEEALGGLDSFRRRLAEGQALFGEEVEKPDYAEADRLSAELRATRSELQRVSNDALETKVRLESLLKDPATGAPVSPSAKLAEVRRDLHDLQTQFHQLSTRHDALELAESTLTGNLLELREALLPRLATQAGVYMQQLSRGNYDSILVNDRLEIMLRDSATGHYYTPDNFSSGTADQLWFSFRLALTDHLRAGRSLPLLLDDLFMNFDDKRALEGLALLAAKAAAGQQVLLLTCHKRLAKFAEQQAGWTSRTLP